MKTPLTISGFSCDIYAGRWESLKSSNSFRDQEKESVNASDTDSK